MSSGFQDDKYYKNLCKAKILRRDLSPEMVLMQTKTLFPFKKSKSEQQLFINKSVISIIVSKYDTFNTKTNSGPLQGRLELEDP